MDELPARPEELLCAEILNEARRVTEEITGCAALEAEQILTTAKREAEKLRQMRMATAKTEAERRAEQILATVPLEKNRLRARLMEKLLEDIRHEAEQQLATGHGFDPRETLLRLAVEAVEQMPGVASFRLRISTASAKAQGSDLAVVIQQRCRRRPLRIEVVADPDVRDGGVIIEDAAGSQLWDNRLRVRLERLWPALRRQLAAQAGLVDGGGS